MRALLDACVLYPTVMREMLLGVAGAGLFVPLWSDRILEEWARAAARHGDAVEAQARGEIALTRVAWPAATIPAAPATEARLWLPDPADVHVLASAVAGSADLIVTENRADFPIRTLREHGLDLAGPDPFLLGFLREQPGAVESVTKRVQSEAERLSGEAWPIRKLLKKARLPRLGKTLEEAGL